jgi:TolA-binding protein
MRLNLFFFLIHLIAGSAIPHGNNEIKTFGDSIRVSIEASGDHYPTLIVLGDEFKAPSGNINVVNIATKKGFYSHFPDLNGDLYGIQQALKWLVDNKPFLFQNIVYLLGNGPFGSRQAIYIASFNQIHLTQIFSSVFLINPNESVLKVYTMDQFENQVIYPLAEKLGCFTAGKTLNEAVDCIKKNQNAPNSADEIGIDWRPVVDGQYVFSSSLHKLPKPIYVLTDEKSCEWIVGANELERYTTVVKGRLSDFFNFIFHYQQSRVYPSYNGYYQHVQQQNDDNWFNMFNNMMMLYLDENHEFPKRKRKRYYIEEPIHSFNLSPPSEYHLPQTYLHPASNYGNQFEIPMAISEKCHKKSQEDCCDKIKKYDKQYSEYYEKALQFIQLRDQMTISGLSDQLKQNQKEMKTLEEKLEKEKEKLIKKNEELEKQKSESSKKAEEKESLNDIHDHICYLIGLYENLVDLLKEINQHKEDYSSPHDGTSHVEPVMQRVLQPEVKQPVPDPNTVQPQFPETQSSGYLPSQIQTQPEQPLENQMISPTIMQSKDFSTAEQYGQSLSPESNTAPSQIILHPTEFQDHTPHKSNIKALKQKCNKHEVRLVY